MKEGPPPIIARCPTCKLAFTSKYGLKYHQKNVDCKERTIDKFSSLA